MNNSAIEVLENRMRLYEGSFTYLLPPRFPYIIRINYHGFSSLKDNVSNDTLNDIFQLIANEMSSSIQGCVLSHRIQDEISFVILNNKSAGTQPWLGGDINSITSITASMATAYFMKAIGLSNIAVDKIPIFKSRVFILPDMNEVNNYFLWRDSTKNKYNSNNILIIKSENKWTPVYIQHSSISSMIDMINKTYEAYISN